MAIITRPNKPSSGGGTDYVDGADIEANEVNDDLNTMYSDYNGNVTAANMSPAAAIPGTYLADSPSGIPTIKINDDAVTDAKLADHATLDANRAVGTNHIKTDAIISPKIKKLVTTITCGVGSPGLSIGSTFLIDLTTLTQPAGMVLTNPITNLATHIPISCMVERAGGYVGNPDNLVNYQGIIRDSTTDKLYYMINNTSGTNIATFNGTNFRIISLVLS